MMKSEYITEYRQEIISLVIEQDNSAPKTATALDITDKLLYN